MYYITLSYRQVKSSGPVRGRENEGSLTSFEGEQKTGQPVRNVWSKFRQKHFITLSHHSLKNRHHVSKKTFTLQVKEVNTHLNLLLPPSILGPVFIKRLRVALVLI
jgi:hypothetical protein